MFRWGSGVVLAVVVTGFAYLLLTGAYANDGPVLLVVSPYRGLHLGDVFVIVGWAVSIVAIGLLVRGARGRDRS